MPTSAIVAVDEPAPKIARLPNGTFVPGQSGNPGGKPKAEIRVRELAREHTEAAINTLAECLKNEDGRVRVAAAEAILNRGYGRPAQSVELDTNGASVLANLIFLPAEKTDA